MIKARPSRNIIKFFNFYIDRIISSNFREIRILGNVNADNKSILYISNHFSWWDGFFAWQVNRRVFKKCYNVMMLESQLKKHKIFMRIGAFSVSPGTRAIIESMDHCVEILSNKNNLLVYYPQGKLSSLNKNEFVFQKGVDRILTKSQNTCVVLASVLIDYFGYKKPTVVVSLLEYRGPSNTNAIQDAFNNHHQKCIASQENLFET